MDNDDLKYGAVSEEAAGEAGMMPLAGPYALGEQWMARRVLADMRDAGIAHCLVRGGSGLEVWREAEGMLLTENAAKRMNGESVG